MSANPAQEKVNLAGMARADYKGANSTLCQGCGHNPIANQIIAACYELNIVPEDVVKFSGIGCSSKSPTYFLSRSFGFNGLHGRMPSLALGALFADSTLRGMGVSGDGDTASIGLGQFKHLMRRNLPMVYIVENNGVYGLTKGQFSATAEKGLSLKREGTNLYKPVDICKEAVISNATFIARSFAGDPKQVKELLKRRCVTRVWQCWISISRVTFQTRTVNAFVCLGQRSRGPPARYRLLQCLPKTRSRSKTLKKARCAT